MQTAKPKTTRPEGAQGVVSAGGIDELLDETPEYPGHRRGRLEGIEKGRRARWGLGLLALVVPLSLWAGVQAVQHNIEAHRFDIPFAAALPSEEDATMVWEEGKARLGLHEDGVKKILLPDAVIALDKGCRHAQVWVEVEGGRLVRVKEIVGKVVVRGRG